MGEGNGAVCAASFLLCEETAENVKSKETRRKTH